jgi:membrane protease YdiL (CAAX protease family)
MSADAFLITLLYSFAMSMLFGVLFEMTGNLAVSTLAHLFNNLTVLGLFPKLAVPGSIEAFGGGVYVAAYLLITFSFLFLLAHDKSPSLAPIRPSGRPSSKR